MPQIRFTQEQSSDLVLKRSDDEIHFVKVEDDVETLVPVKIGTAIDDEHALTLGYFNQQFDDKLLELLNQYVFLQPVSLSSTQNQDFNDISVIDGEMIFEGFTVSIGDRILLRGQDTKSENGFYVITESDSVEDDDGVSVTTKFKLERSTVQEEAVGAQIQRFHVRDIEANTFYVVSSENFGEEHAMGVSDIEFTEFHIINIKIENGLVYKDSSHNNIEIDPDYLLFEENNGIKELVMHGNKLIVQENDGTGGEIQADTIKVSDLIAQDCTIESDRNIKNSIRPLSAEETHNKVLQLQGVKYKLNKEDNDQDHIGFIAQEVEEVFPEFIKQGDIKSVNYSQMVAVLIESIKHQNSVIKSLETRIKALE